MRFKKVVSIFFRTFVFKSKILQSSGRGIFFLSYAHGKSFLVPFLGIELCSMSTYFRVPHFVDAMW